MVSVNNTVDDSSPLIIYQPEGAWHQGNETSDSLLNGSLYFHHSYTRTWYPGASASFQFNGTSISIHGVKRYGYGEYIVTLDGVNSTANANVTGINFDASSVELFSRMGMEQGLHSVVLTNNPEQGSNSGWTGFDIDYIRWSSNVDFSSSNSNSGTPNTNSNSNSSDAADPSETSPVMRMYHDTDSAYSWGPEGAWSVNSRNTTVGGTQSGHSTSMSGASVNLTFTGQVIRLYGPIGPNYTDTFMVSIDGEPSRTFSAKKAAWSPTQLIYYADNLGPGKHTMVVLNGDARDHDTSDDSVGAARRRDEGNGWLEVNYAEVWQANVTLSSSSNPGTSGNGNSKNTLGQGAIAGISLAAVIVFVCLSSLVWFLFVRNKTHLQRGYMAQPQSEAPLPPSPQRPPRGIRPLSIPHLRLSRQDEIEPYPFTTDTGRNGSAGSDATQLGDSSGSGSGKSGRYTPYTGFGRSSKSFPSSASVGKDLSSSTSLGYGSGLGYEYMQPYPTAYHAGTLSRTDIDIVQLEMRSAGPVRSETLLTASTLVAEDGSDATSFLTRQEVKILQHAHPQRRNSSRIQSASARTPLLSSISTTFRRGSNSTTTSTPPSSFQQQQHHQKQRKTSTLSTPSSATTPSITFSRISSIRHHTTTTTTRRSQTLRSSRSTKRRARSTSPSRAQLLNPLDTGVHSGHTAGGGYDNWAGDGTEDDDEDDPGADFYADEAFYGVSSPTRSLAAQTQSDAQTPVIGWEDDEHLQYPVPLLPRSRPSSTSKRVSIGVSVEPERRLTDESLPPPYTSRRATLAL